MSYRIHDEWNSYYNTSGNVFQTNTYGFSDNIILLHNMGSYYVLHRLYETFSVLAESSFYHYV